MKFTGVSFLVLSLAAVASAVPQRFGRKASPVVADRTISGSLDTNAKRLAAGLPPLPARKLWSPTASTPQSPNMIGLVLGLTECHISDKLQVPKDGIHRQFRAYPFISYTPTLNNQPVGLRKSFFLQARRQSRNQSQEWNCARIYFTSLEREWGVRIGLRLSVTC